MLLWTDRSKVFAGTVDKPEEADVFLLGVPYDSGAISTPGQRLAPLEIRLAMEKFEERKVRIFDLGDLQAGPEYPVLEKRLMDTISRIPGKFVCLGGDHSISLPIIKALKPKKVVSLDAHCDFRDEWLGSKINAATVMKRVSEISEVTVVGVREMFGGNCVMAEKINEFNLKKFEGCYLSVDVDVLDPSIAPGTGTPVPNGLELAKVIDLIKRLKPVAADIVEVNPLVERAITPTVAAQLTWALVNSKKI